MKKLLHLCGSKFFVLTITVSLLAQSSSAQLRLFENAEIGVTIAPSNFLGDLGGNFGKGTRFLKDNNFSMTRVFFGAHLTLMPTDWLGARLALNIGSVAGSDAAINGKGGMEEARIVRNQDFKSGIKEAFLALEFFPTVFFEDDPSDDFNKLRPYALAGVGFFHFNPKGRDPLTGEYVPLKPLSTEGQGFPQYPDRKPYSLNQLNIPLGIGVKYWIGENVSLSLEVIHRQTFTDYMDDVSTNYINPAAFDANFGAGSAKAQLAKRMADKRLPGHGFPVTGGDKRGTPTHKDSYYSFGFKLGFRLGGNNGWANSTRCPVLRY